MMPLVTAPWFGADGNPLPIRPMPGLRPEVIQGLECLSPGIIGPAFRALLAKCCGFAGTELGSIDFTGCCFPQEPCPVLRPCLTLAIDGDGRRWIAESGEKDLPGPIWCVFSEPEVAVYVSDDLAGFIATLHDRACRDQTRAWFLSLTARARAIWARRHRLAVRPRKIPWSDEAIRGWLLGLPFDAYVYDLRTRTIARGWPYGLAGPRGRLYRCGRLPVFAVAGSPAEGGRTRAPQANHYDQTAVRLRPCA